MIIHKIQGWPQATKPITTNKNDNNILTSRNDHQQYQQLQPATSNQQLSVGWGIRIQPTFAIVRVVRGD